MCFTAWPTASTAAAKRPPTVGRGPARSLKPAGAPSGGRYVRRREMSVEGSFLLESVGFDCFRHVATPRCLATRKCARCDRSSPADPRPWGARPLVVPWSVEGALLRRAPRVQVPPMAVGDGYRSRTPGTRIERGGTLMPRAHLLPVPWPLEGALLRRAVRVRVPPMAGVDEQQMRAR